MKKILLVLALALTISSCKGPDGGQGASEDKPELTEENTEDGQEEGKKEEDLEKYDYTFFNTFDTVVNFQEFARSEEDFNEDKDLVESEFRRLHKLADNYKTYEGINNIKTVNDMAGKGPVEVDPDLVDLVDMSISLAKKYGSKVNIAMGSVLSIWHDYREDGLENPESAKLPPMEVLKEAADHTDLDDIVVDKKAQTIEILDPDLEIDLGSTAKGYATELVAQELEDKGVESGLISAGGNVRIIGSPKGEREKWAIGIQNPENAKGESDQRTIEVLYLGETSIVTSGDYQRYYTVDGRDYHHIIDPQSLMPADYYTSLTVMLDDSGLADFLSTSAFLLPIDESRQMVEDFGAEAIWITTSGEKIFTPGIEASMKSQGAVNE